MAKSVGSKSATPAQFRYAVLSVRGALLASAALALVAGLTSLPAVAAMPGFGPYYSNPDLYFDPYEAPNPIVRPRSTARPNPQPDLKAAPKPGPKTTLKPEPAKDVGAVPKGPLQIVVSIADQHVTLYSNGVRVTRSSGFDRRAGPADADRGLQHHPEGPLSPFQSLQQCPHALHGAHHLVGRRVA